MSSSRSESRLSVTDADTTFKHKPLRPTSSKIPTRLVRIISFDADETIQVEVFDADVTKIYVCISYEWGLPAKTRTILVNGKPFAVGESAWQSVAAAHRYCPQTPIWIDQLCIDESNAAERGEQVRQMGLVFQQAENVVVWLGQGTIDQQVLLNMVQEIWSADGVDEPKRMLNYHRLLSQYIAGLGQQGVAVGTDLKRSQSLIEAEDHVRIVIRSISDLSYWTRCWIQQEFFVARQLTLTIGPASCRWDKFWDFLQCCRENSRRSLGRSTWLSFARTDTGNASSSNLSRLAGMRSWAESNNRNGVHSLSMVDSLLGFGQVFCSDFHDKVYGLQGLAVDGHQIIPDYSRKRIDLFFDVMDIVVAQSGQKSALNLLKSPVSRGGRGSHYGPPSKRGHDLLATAFHIAEHLDIYSDYRKSVTRQACDHYVCEGLKDRYGQEAFKGPTLKRLQYQGIWQNDVMASVIDASGDTPAPQMDELMRMVKNNLKLKSKREKRHSSRKLSEESSLVHEDSVSSATAEEPDG